MDEANNCLHYAEIAFANKQYAEALSWYEKALGLTPNDLYALSRAGALCVSAGQFDRALVHFRRAKELDPQNGDNHFNYANACFFKKDFAGAFAGYVTAEKVGCSGDVTPRLYYQMALLCSLRQDIRSALIYFDKCEKSDTTGTLSLSPDLISEKLKLYMLLEDHKNAAITAAQLVAIRPAVFRHYMVCFSLLMADKSFAEAEKLLSDAEQYAEMTDADRITLLQQTASLYVAEAESDGKKREVCFAKAVGLLENRLAAGDITKPQRVQLLMTLSEVYQKAGMPDKAIACLNYILGGLKEPAAKPAEKLPEIPGELSSEEIDEMIRSDTERIQELLYYGELDDSAGAYAPEEYDEEGYPLHILDDPAFDALMHEQAAEAPAASDGSEKEEPFVLSAQDREKVLFMLMTAHLAKDDHAPAGKLADILKHSGNKYYAYYGLYVSAYVCRQLCTDPAVVSRRYAEALAFFRGRMFADHADTLAAVFRARLYAEDGKTEKAMEIVKLLSDADQKAVLEYIRSLPRQ